MRYQFEVDQERAALHGISVARIAQALKLMLSGSQAGLLHVPQEREDVTIELRPSLAMRAGIDRLKAVKVLSPDGRPISLSSLVKVRETAPDRSIYHKNLMPVVYVIGDVAGAKESPVYAILEMRKKVEALSLPEGYRIAQHTAAVPESDRRFSIKWDGEWHITYEVFRDLGIAFGIVLVLIFVLVVGWFQSYSTPFVIMVAIPFSLIGILPAHWLMGAFFTATSMIGFIAGAGIVVRNSIILVDFIELRLGQGMSLDQAVIDAGAVRFRPMMLTAAAVVVGGLGDPFRPDLSGTCHLADGRRGRIAPLFPHDRPDPVLPGQAVGDRSSTFRFHRTIHILGIECSNPRFLSPAPPWLVRVLASQVNRSSMSWARCLHK